MVIGHFSIRMWGWAVKPKTYQWIQSVRCCVTSPGVLRTKVFPAARVRVTKERNYPTEGELRKPVSYWGD